MPAKAACESLSEKIPSAASLGAVHSLAPLGLRQTQMQQSGLRSLVPPKKEATRSPFFSSTMVAPWHSEKEAFSYRNSSLMMAAFRVGISTLK